MLEAEQLFCSVTQPHESPLHFRVSCGLVVHMLHRPGVFVFSVTYPFPISDLVDSTHFGIAFSH